ncbi:PREDICTED: probable purine permease 10 [Prunus mume]|uniref:Probable purine permease n=1 Tax=Prunus mume TaxID=102107 RepID=A0ABM0NLY5_PRUMU|nr:PREDICTED: probable purine permease 10 [Prunus mume]
MVGPRENSHDRIIWDRAVHHQDANGANSRSIRNTSVLPQGKSFNWWLRMTLYTCLVLSGQSVATLLGRLYFDKGGHSNWLQALMNLAGFPLLLPYYCIPALRKRNNPTTNSVQSEPPPSTLTLASVYVSLGLLVAFGCFLYSVGLSYLPVSTYSLICASQLAFNALFSFFLNSQKFTPYIFNALFLLTISSVLLVFQGDSDSGAAGVTSKGKYVIGFLCTVAASASYGLTLSLTQLAFRKVIRKETFTAVMDMIVYQSLIASCAIFIGLFASGEWKGLKKEMGEFKSGKVSYIMNLTWSAIVWQLFAIGGVGLIFEASSLFSNVVSALGLPVVPVLAVIFFHDKMDRIKIVAMVLAIWGFVSYLYQHYLDDRKAKTAENENANGEVSTILPP